MRGRDDSGDRENELEQGGAREEMTSLPPEIWTIIINHAISRDPSSRYTLMYVNRMFLNILRTIPLPSLYISPDILLNVPRILSVRRIIRVSGRNSGLVMAVRQIVRNPRWANAWLHLRETDNRWFDITYIWWRSWRCSVVRVP